LPAIKGEETLEGTKRQKSALITEAKINSALVFRTIFFRIFEFVLLALVACPPKTDPSVVLGFGSKT